MTQGGWTPWPPGPQQGSQGYQGPPAPRGAEHGPPRLDPPRLDPPRLDDRGSWPDETRSWPDNTRSRPDERSWPDEPSSLWPPTAPIVAVPGQRRPYPSPSLALPIIGALLVAAATAALWITTDTVRPAGLFGSWYAFSGAAYAVALLATVYGFAANLDSNLLRWVHAGVGLCAGAAVVFLGAPFQPGSAATVFYQVLGTVVLLTAGVGFLVGLAMLPRLERRLIGRLVGAAVPLAYAAVHFAAVYSSFASPPAAVQLAAAGYVLFAIGAAIGPRYRS